MSHRYAVEVRGPIDTWAGWQTVCQFLAQDSSLSEMSHVEFFNRLCAATIAAGHEGLEYELKTGRLRIEPMVAGLPDEGDGHALLMFAFKVDANGTVYLVRETWNDGI